MAAIQNRITHVLLLLVLLALVAVIGMLAAGVRGGPLDPPGAPPAFGTSTKTLDQIPGSWDRRLTSTNGLAGPAPPAGCNSDRFKCVLTTCVGSPICAVSYPAVLDLETGLVWERVPSTSTYLWADAIIHCNLLSLGERFGWRLATDRELRSLSDTSADSLPDGHPFVLSSPPTFWSSTTDPNLNGASAALTVGLGAPGTHIAQVKDLTLTRAWCVRGGSGYDGGVITSH